MPFEKKIHFTSILLLNCGVSCQSSWLPL